MKIMKVRYVKEGHPDIFDLDVPFNAIKLVNVFSEEIEEYSGGKHIIITAYWEIASSSVEKFE